MLVRIEKCLWSWPLLLLIVGTGLYLTVRLRGLQFRRLPRALREAVTKGDKSQGGVSSFGALCLSLSATIGTGNIVGAATAVAVGGPGALLWMELSALTGMAVKYAEGVLAVKYRVKAPDGAYSGGPFRYMEKGLGSRWKPLAKTFAFLGAFAGLCGVGTFVQMNSITAGLDYVLLTNGLGSWLTFSLFGRSVSWITLILAAVLAVLTWRIIAGGVERISGVSTVVVPLMGGLYVLGSLWILLTHGHALGQVLGQVFSCAFSAPSVGGGALGGVMAVAGAGISRGVFSNEAGLGSGPIAAAAAQTDSPEEQGLMGMVAGFFDTVVVCTMTGLVVLVTGTTQSGLEGTAITMEAFSLGMGLPRLICQGFVLVCLTLFALTTVVGWNYYGTQCLGYLSSSSRLLNWYQRLYVLSVFLAPFLSVSSVWTLANICNGLMALPNLVAVLLLADVVCQEAAKYKRRN